MCGQLFEYPGAPEQGDQRIDRRGLRLAGQDHAQRHRQLRHLETVLGDHRFDQRVDRRRFPVHGFDARRKVGQCRPRLGGQVLGQQVGVGLDMDVENLDGVGQDVERVAALDAGLQP